MPILYDIGVSDQNSAWILLYRIHRVIIYTVTSQVNIITAPFEILFETRCASLKVYSVGSNIVISVIVWVKRNETPYLYKKTKSPAISLPGMNISTPTLHPSDNK